MDSFFYKDNISNKTKGTIGAGGESQDPITTIPDKKRKASWEIKPALLLVKIK